MDPIKIPSRQLATCRYAVAAAAPLSYQLNSVLIEFISCPQRCPAHGCCLHASSPLSFVSKSRIHFTSSGSSSAKAPKSSLFATKSTTECDQALKSGEAFAHSDTCQLISFYMFLPKLLHVLFKLLHVLFKLLHVFFKKKKYSGEAFAHSDTSQLITLDRGEEEGK